MNWRQARDVRDLRTKDSVFDALGTKAVLPIRIVATPVQYIDPYGMWQKGPWGLMVTSERIQIAKKTLSGLKVAIDMPLNLVRSTGVRLQGGHGPLYELEIRPGQGGVVHILFYDLDSATAVFDAMQSV